MKWYTLLLSGRGSVITFISPIGMNEIRPAARLLKGRGSLCPSAGKTKIAQASCIVGPIWLYTSEKTLGRPSITHFKCLCQNMPRISTIRVTIFEETTGNNNNGCNNNNLQLYLKRASYPNVVANERKASSCLLQGQFLWGQAWFDDGSWVYLPSSFRPEDISWSGRLGSSFFGSYQWCSHFSLHTGSCAGL